MTIAQNYATFKIVLADDERIFNIPIKGFFTAGGKKKLQNIFVVYGVFLHFPIQLI